MSTYQYDDWGRLQNKTEQFALPIRYANYWYDQDAGLYHLGARWYDPSLMRFTTADSHPGDKDNPLSLNEYLYVNNNPLINTDPDGKFSLALVGVGVSLESLMAALSAIVAGATAPAWLVPAIAIAGIGTITVLLARKAGKATPKPPGYGTKWKKKGQKWIDNKTGRTWRWHAPDSSHPEPHWDVETPGKPDQRYYPGREKLGRNPWETK